MRKLLVLRWDDIDRTAGELRLRDAKTGPRWAPLTALVAAVTLGVTVAAASRTLIPASRRAQRCAPSEVVARYRSVFGRGDGVRICIERSGRLIAVRT